MRLDQLWAGGRLHELDRDECAELLASTRIGRIAYNDADGPVVLPVNYIFDGQTVLFRTSPYGDLARHLAEVVAFQVDGFDDFTESGWSVLVRGRAAVIDHGDLPGWSPRPHPWPEGVDQLLVQVRPRSIAGRRLFPS